MTAETVFHIGMTVSDIERAVAFWDDFLGTTALRRRLDFPELGRITGYPGLICETAYVTLPGGTVLELLDYRLDQPPAVDSEATAAPGHMHVALQVSDVDRSLARAIALGARPVADAPVDVVTGDYAGARSIYVRIPPDGQTLELFQPPPGS